MARVVFSIDLWYDLRSLSKFLRMLETQRVMGKLRGEFKILQGFYKGAHELSFLCDLQDYKDFVEPYGWTKNQESILVIEDDSKAYLKYKELPSEYIGVWSEVYNPDHVENWAYDPRENRWWSCI